MTTREHHITALLQNVPGEQIDVTPYGILYRVAGGEWADTGPEVAL